jgi:hypothetical protein
MRISELYDPPHHRISKGFSQMTPDACNAGLRVRVIGAPERQGSIANDPREIDGRWFVRVNFDDGARRNTPVDHLEPLADHRDAINEIKGGRFEGPESLRRNLLHEKLNGRLATSTVTPLMDEAVIKNRWLGKLTRLNPATGRGACQGNAPHKPLLLLALIDLAESGELTTRSFTSAPHGWRA